MNEHRWLAESENFKVYSIYDNVYIKNKKKSNSLNQYQKTDKHIQWIYGEPNGAIIMPKEDKTIIVGSGIYIYDINSEKLIEKYNDPKHIKWIDTIYQAEGDDWLNEFRIVTLNNDDQLRVFKVTVSELTLTEIK